MYFNALNPRCNNNVNFTGKFIDNATIQAYDGKKYVDKEVAFVELDPENPRDVLSAEDAYFMWGGFAKDISKDIFLNPKNYKYYALTTQDSNFEEIQSKKFLGLVEVQEKSDINTVEYLQVNPSYILKRKDSVMDSIVKFFTGKDRKEKPPEFQGVGRAILNSLKSITERSIDLYSVKTATGFYDKNGFKPESEKHPRHYIWNKE